MVENFKRFRQPLTILLQLVIAAGMAISIVRLVVELTAEKAPVAAAFQDIANSVMPFSLVVVLAVFNWLCLFVAPATKDAVRLIRISTWLVTIGTILTLVATVLGLSASAGTFAVIMEFLGGLLDILLKTAVAVVLGVVSGAIRRGTMTPKPTEVEAAPAAPEAVVAEPEPEASAPSWRPAEATGAVWNTAEQAAAGEPAADGGQPRGASTWQPRASGAKELDDPTA